MNASKTELVCRVVARRARARARPRSLTAAISAAPPLARARWQVWAPLGLRAVALLVALLGLAGIGSVAAQAPRSRAPVAVRAGLELASLAVPGLAGSGGVETLASPGPAPAPRAEPPAPAAPCPTPGENPAGAGRAQAAAERAPVVLNRATAEELQQLPGVGAKRAAAILALRQRLGRFQRTSDLLRVKGIGPRVLARLLPHVVLD